MSLPEEDSIRAVALLKPMFTSPETARDAAEVLAGHARDAIELRGWLDALGLLPHLAMARAERDRDAAIVLAGRAADAAELRGWLEALGLVAP
jgi:hypothetical protein